MIEFTVQVKVCWPQPEDGEKQFPGCNFGMPAPLMGDPHFRCAVLSTIAMTALRMAATLSPLGMEGYLEAIGRDVSNLLGTTEFHKDDND